RQAAPRARRRVPGSHLSELHKTVLVPTFDLESDDSGDGSRKPKFLHNFPRPGDDGAVRAIEAALRTSASNASDGCWSNQVVAHQLTPGLEAASLLRERTVQRCTSAVPTGTRSVLRCSSAAQRRCSVRSEHPGASPMRPRGPCSLSCDG